MRGLVLEVETGGTAAGSNPLIRPSGAFSQREKALEPRGRWVR